MWSIRSSFWLWLLLSDAVAEDVKEIIVTLQPGKLGLTADWNSGRVTKIDGGGQANKMGIEVGMVMTQIDDKKYYEELLDRRLSGNKPFTMTLKVFPPATTTTTTPLKPNFKYLKELDVDSYEWQVRRVANETESPKYFPVVMFHVSWCKHCRAALLELEKAAEIVVMAEQKGQLQGMQAVPKFFTIECDLEADKKALCEEYASTNFPCIKLFRDQREVLFNRPRIANTFAWWSTYVSRRATGVITDAESFGDGSQTLMLLHADPGKHQDIMQAWEEVALDNIEYLHFAFVHPGSKASQQLPAAPSVAAKGPGLEPLPFEGEMTQQSLADWVTVNQFAPVEELNVYNVGDLKRSGLVVVVQIFNGDATNSSKVVEDFRFKAKQLRKESSGQFLFATLDVANEENTEFLNSVYKLLSPKMSPPPRIFALEGSTTFWESPDMTIAKDLTLETLQVFLASSEARHDDSTMAWLKEKRKLYVRTATGSTTGALFAIMLPIVVIGSLWCVLKTLFASDDDVDSAKKAD